MSVEHAGHRRRQQAMLLDRMRAASVSAESSGNTGTAACNTIGPPSSSGVTRCTVQPATFTPCARAWAGASVPGKAGSSDGCTFRTGPVNFARNPALKRRMKPARHTSRTSRVEQRVGDPLVERLARRPSGVRNHQRLDPRLPGPGQRRRAGDVRDDDRDRGVEPAAVDGVDQRLEVRTAARHQDADSAATGRVRHIGRRACRRRSGPRPPATLRPREGAPSRVTHRQRPRRRSARCPC